MNYGVCAKATDVMEHYGILEDVIEVCYVGDSYAYKMIFFKCDWFDSINGVSVHDTKWLMQITQRGIPSMTHMSFHVKTQVCFTPYSMQGTKRKDYGW